MKKVMIAALATLAACAESPAAPDGEPALARKSTQYVVTDWQGKVWSSGPIEASIGDNGSFNFQAGGRGKNAPP